MIRLDGDLPGSFSGERTSRAAGWLVGALSLGCVAGTAALLPVAATPGPVLPAATTTFGTTVFIADLCTGVLLLAQFRLTLSWSMLLLAAAYLYSAAMALLHVLSFPGAWMPDGPLLGSPQTVGWLFIPWVLGYPLLVLAAILADGRGSGRRIAQHRANGTATAVVGTTLAAVTLLALGAIFGQDWLPHELQGNSFATWGNVAQWTAVVLSLFAFVALWVRTRGRSVLYGWLGLALIAFAASNALAVAGGARYTLGWDLGRISGMVSASVLLVYFLGRFLTLHRSLASAAHSLREANLTLERRVTERTTELEAANLQLRKTLAERNVLLREVYHRVKNNLQIVDSLIALQTTAGSGVPPEEALNDLRYRINALGLVHQQLMTSDDLATFDIRPFLDELRVNLAAAGGGDGRNIALTMHADPLMVDLDFAIPLGLLITELVTNAFKHAFAGNRDGRIDVHLGRRDGALVLTISDDGLGHTIPVAEADAEPGFGLTIVQALVGQLEGEMSVSRNAGTAITIQMPLPEARQ